MASHSSFRPRVLAAAFAGLLAAGGIGMSAQTPGAAPSNPPFSRTADGKPDLSGVWQALAPASYDIEPHHARPGVPPSQGIVVGGTIPYLPAAIEQRKKNYEERETADTEAKCFLPGVPRLMYMPFPFQIVQTPDEVLTIHEYARAIRHIYTNGTKHPHGPIEWWLGDSRARWEGDTLVVDTVHFTNQTWLDHSGNFHSEELHVVERFTLDGPDHLVYHATLEDPKVFSRPWDIETVLYRRKEKDVQILEYNCYGFEYESLYP